MKIFKHIYWAIRYGYWSTGWESYDGKPMFGFYYCYYDGYQVAFHLYKLYISVSY